MFNGTSQASESNPYTPKTGIAAFQLVAVNPTKPELDAILGREYPFELKYDLMEMNEQQVRPINMWVKSGSIIEPLRFYVSTKEKVAMSGSKRYINAKGQFKYAQSEAELKEKYPDFGSFRPALEGEFELYSFIQRLIRYKPSADGAQFLKDMEAGKMTVSTLYAGDFSGLKALVPYAAENKCSIGLLLAVRQKPRTNDDGTETIVDRQVIVSKPDAFFTLPYGKISDFQHNKLREIYTESVERGYPLTNDLFTIKYQDFNKADCINQAPGETASPASSVSKDDLPF